MATLLRFTLHLQHWLVWQLVVASLFVSITFLLANKVTSAVLRVRPEAQHWEAAVASHGDFYRGYLITAHPLACVIVLVVLKLAVVLLLILERRLRRHDRLQAPDGQPALIASTELLWVLNALSAYPLMALLIAASR